MSKRNFSKPKGFQIATADAALANFSDSRSMRRFLIADEVGLGKTVVARTIVERMMKGRRTPLVVFYMASNLNIAFQNRRKLLELIPEPEREQAAATADRLTLAANPSLRPSHDRLHLYTLTPDTSIPLYRRRGGTGRLEERALIFRLLTGRFSSLADSNFRKLFQGRAGDASWRESLRRQEEVEGVRELQDLLIGELGDDPGWKADTVDADSIGQIAGASKKSEFMGRLRNALALAALAQIRPHLVIFDEFQKFRPVLINEKEAIPDPVSVQLRGTGRPTDAAVLLLSATPYRLYSSRREEAAGISHHQQFYELIRFLFGPGTRHPSEVEKALNEFGAQMLSTEPDFASLQTLQAQIQVLLKPVMSRTERKHLEAILPSGHAPGIPISLERDDLRVFKHWVARLKAARGSRSDLTCYAVPYWFSIPLPVQMMGQDYVAWRHADHSPRRDEPRLRSYNRNHLRPLESWPHPQMRAAQQLMPSKQLALPWIAPSLPWWPLQQPWNETIGAEGAIGNINDGGGKMLVFSRFKAVPPAIASLLSYGLETEWAHRLRQDYEKDEDARPSGSKKNPKTLYDKAGDAQPLQFTANRTPLVALFFPSPTLIAHTEPLRAGFSSLKQVGESMRQQIRDLLKSLQIPTRRTRSCRPIWKLVGALERTREWQRPEETLPDWSEIQSCFRRAAGNAQGQKELMWTALSNWTEESRDGLEFVTQAEIARLAEFALAGPGVVLGRALFRFDPTSLVDESFRRLVDLSWSGLRTYLNTSFFKAALTRRRQRYPGAILEAVVAGNLESVLDEHIWITSQLDADAVHNYARDLKSVLSLRAGRHRIFEPHGRNGRMFTLRCHAAMPFADAKVANASTGEDQRIRTDELRRAFNTPFWPHVLATTSLGQEGLDFHVWCRRLLHWDLCSSPLDLEQREGRIQRFGGLSIRKALASQLKQVVCSTPMPADKRESPWSILARHAEHTHAHDASGLQPWWVCKDDQVDCHFVELPQSRHEQRITDLREKRYHYRLALGQPQQQDFIEQVGRHGDDRDRFILNLSAWHDPGAHLNQTKGK
jgi:hypothetical protein